MQLAKIALSFLGSLLPVVFPDHKFNPQRLVAVAVLMILLGISLHFLGVENTEVLIELTDSAIELTEE